MKIFGKLFVLLFLLSRVAFAEGEIDLPVYGGAVSWKSAVANAAALPVVSNTAGDARVTLNNQDIYIWSGSAWVLAASPSLSGPAIGGPITGGTAKSVLFVNPSGIIAQDNANLSYNILTHQLYATMLSVAGLSLFNSDGSGYVSSDMINWNTGGTLFTRQFSVGGGLTAYAVDISDYNNTGYDIGDSVTGDWNISNTGVLTIQSISKPGIFNIASNGAVSFDGGAFTSDGSGNVDATSYNGMFVGSVDTSYEIFGQGGLDVTGGPGSSFDYLNVSTAFTANTIQNENGNYSMDTNGNVSIISGAGITVASGGLIVVGNIGDMAIDSSGITIGGSYGINNNGTIYGLGFNVDSSGNTNVQNVLNVTAINYPGGYFNVDDNGNTRAASINAGPSDPEDLNGWAFNVDGTTGTVTIDQQSGTGNDAFVVVIGAAGANPALRVDSYGSVFMGYNGQFEVDSGGDLTLGTTSGTPASGVGTLTNLPAGHSGNPIYYWPITTPTGAGYIPVY